MFSKIFFKAAAVTAMLASVMATPVPAPVSSSIVARGGSHSFDNWMGFSSLGGFDNFYGSDNFSGRMSSETVVEQDSKLVCHGQSIQIIQQRLLVLQEMAKRIITEQICDVETQTIVFEQFHSSMGHFSGDLRRKSHRGVGYDRGISSHFGSIVGSDGSLSSNDLGFSGHDLGSQYVIPGGSNWNDASSPASVDAAFNASRSAIKDH
ncbi:hypothetical protein CVT24_010671 [Panaeolus cyanescens]|uniref:Uncharacterized protein n=1 Tax=Panaeolus cyanescens TaxID=181874 RepID=A0A409YM38_9AGAR|nr:hypothetical protein CVT24_010671 [Panaeolus cyanescens]